MVSYTAGAAALMAVTGLTAEAEGPKKLRSFVANKQHNDQRKLYEDDHYTTDSETKCNQVIEGYPQVCILVCTEVTSIYSGSKLIDETAKTTQKACDPGWETDDASSSESWSGDTEWPTYSPSSPWPTYVPTEWSGDEYHHETGKPTKKPTKKPSHPPHTPFPTTWEGSAHSPEPTQWTDDGHSKEITDWTDDGWLSYSESSKDDEWGPSVICTSKSGWSAPSWSGSVTSLTSIDEWVSPPSLDEWKSPPSWSGGWSVNDSSGDGSWPSSKGGKAGKGSKGGSSKGGKAGKGGKGGSSKGGSSKGGSSKGGGSYSKGGKGRRLLEEASHNNNNSDRKLGWNSGGWGNHPVEKKDWASDGWAGSDSKGKGSSKGGSKGGSKGSSKGSSKGDSKGSPKGDSKGSPKGDSKGSSKGGSKGSSKGDSKGSSKSDSKGSTGKGSKGSSSGGSAGSGGSGWSSKTSKGGKTGKGGKSKSTKYSSESWGSSSSPTICHTYAPTEDPTPRPTPRPTRKPVPQSCGDQGWYFDSSNDQCTRDVDGDKPSDIVYGNKLVCCIKYFGSLGECNIYDGCTLEPTLSPTDKPTNKPTKKPTNKPTPYPITAAPTTCDSRTWYYNPHINGGICENYIKDHPEEFDSYSTLYGCCMEHYSGELEQCHEEKKDECCELENSHWHWNEEHGYCTNMAQPTPYYGSSSTEYDSEGECCKKTKKLGYWSGYPCPVNDVCYPPATTPEPTKKPTPNPTPNPTPYPVTAAPTACTDRPWYFNPHINGGICENYIKDHPEDFDSYSTLYACCLDKYPGQPVLCANERRDECCELAYSDWRWDYENGYCTNMVQEMSNDSNLSENGFESEGECCYKTGKEGFWSGECPVYDYCYPPAPTPEYVVTPAPSPEVTFGSTPTVSKETTGPPTEAGGRVD